MNTTLLTTSSAPRFPRSRFSSRQWRARCLTAYVERLHQPSAASELSVASRPAPSTAARAWPRLRFAALAVVALLSVSRAPEARADVLDHWTTQTAAPNLSGNDSIFRDGRYIAVGNGGRIIHTTNLSSGWQTIQSPVTTTLLKIIHAGGQYVVSGNNGVILTSPNGTDWTLRSTGTTQQLRSVAYGNGRYIAAGGMGTVLHSPDAVTWTPASFDWAGFHAYSVAFGNGLFVAVGEHSTTYHSSVLTSPDGITWTRRNTGYVERLEAISYGNGLFVASGWDRAILTSPNGIDWTRYRPTTQYSGSRFWESRYLNGRHIVGGQSGTLVSSPDGANWTVHQTGSTSDIASFLYDGNALVLIRSSGVVRVSQSWAPVSNPGGDGSGSGGGSGGDGSGGGGSGNGGNGGGSGNGGNGGGASGGSGGGDTTNSTSKLVNISTRAWAGQDSSKLISGFVIQGSEPLKVLVRAVGPALSSYGVSGVLADPRLTLFNGSSAQIAANDDWGTHPDQPGVLNAFSQAGAFALPAGSKDSVLLVTLQPGAYSVHIDGANASTGVALAEVYAIGTSSSRLINISSRTFVGTGSDVTISGFVVAGDGPRKVLIRGVGPSLGRLGVAGALANPRVALYNSSQAVVAENDDWTAFADQAALTAAMSQAGAFGLDAGSQDAAMLVTLNPGLYSVIASGVNNSTGIGLIEVYQLP
jgi:hypothetical protein